MGIRGRGGDRAGLQLGIGQGWWIKQGAWVGQGRLGVGGDPSF